MQKMNELADGLKASLDLFTIEVLSLISRWIRPGTKMDASKAIALLKDGI